MILSTDSTANLPKSYYKDLEVSMIPMQIYLDGEIYDDLSEKLPIKDFYTKMKNGAEPKTAQINEQTAKEYFENLLATGDDILHISFSSALSGNTATIIKVAEELNKTHKNKIVVIDSLNASVGEGLLVLYARDFINEGKSIDEIANLLNELKTRCCSYFTVEHLKYLVRGGRVSKISGAIGTLLNIKPVLHVDDNGRLVGYKKVMSRKKALNELANICAEKIADKKYVFIAHAVCQEQAESLANIVNEKIGVLPKIIDLTQVIGSHAGPDLMAIFFISKEGK